MKKRTVAAMIMALAMCFALLSGCGGGGVTNTNTPTEGVASAPDYSYRPGLDAQNKYSLFSVTSFQENDEYYCGSTRNGSNLYYYDKETGHYGILCADPSCTHDSSACGAYVNTGSMLFLYDGLRYWITWDTQDGRDYILWQADLGGTNQKKVKTISFEDILLPYSPQQFDIHRGNLYFLSVADFVSGTNTGTQITVMVSPLDDTEEFTSLFNLTCEQNVAYAIRYVGNCAFLHLSAYDNDGSNAMDTIYRINLDSGETDIIYEEAGVTSYGFWVTEQGEVYVTRGKSLCKLENEGMVTVCAFAHCEDMIFLMDGIAVNYYMQDKQFYIEAVDLSGNTVYDGPMFPNGIPGTDGETETYKKYSLIAIGGDRDKLVIELDRRSDGSSFVILFDVNNNMEAALLWKTE